MDPLFVPALLFLAGAVVGIVGMARLAWRTFRHDEEMVAGGSMSRQMLGRSKRDEP